MQFFQRITKGLFILLYTLLLACGFYACASVGSPEGGNYDLDPPKFLGSTPEPNTIRFDKNKITLLFDEYITLEKPSEKVIITPPQKKSPLILGVGRKITVELKDSLLPNTTYTFDFTNAITDNNEKNALEGFTFAFSTGDVVDSLVISGLLLNAENLEPMPNVMVGIHSDLSDTAFTKLPFLRTSQTNELGRFWIRNVTPGAYHLFALNDANRDFKFDQPEEAIAFYDSLIIPSFEPAVRMDTVWKDSLTIDSLVEVHYTRFTPDDVLLRMFKEDFKLQYLSKTERINPRQFVMNFNASQDFRPEVHVINAAEWTNEWYVLEQSADKKTLTYWMTDSLIYQKDTLIIEAAYQAHDTLGNLVTMTDTVKLIQRKKDAPKKEKNEENKVEFLNVDCTPKGSMDIYDTLKITFSEPVLPFDPRLIRFQQKVDTLWENRELPFIQDTLNPRLYSAYQNWAFKQEYRIQIDSAAIFSIYDKWNDAAGFNLKTKAEEEYANLFVKIIGIDSLGLGQLLDSGEKVVRESVLQDGELIFDFIKPGKYFLRYIVDSNGNGKWDTGNYAGKRQPEQVYYYPGFFELKQYMELEQTWNVTELPVERQKPQEITKNKPKEKKQPPKENKQNAHQKNANPGNSNAMQMPSSGAGMRNLSR